MQRILLSLAMASAMVLGVAHAQDTVRPQAPDVTRIASDVEKLKAIKVSGYIQSEWQHFDQTSSLGGRALYSDARKNIFTIRRGRIKFQHRLGDLMSYTIQPDITESGVSIKDAFVTLHLLDDDALLLDGGMFNRPNEEVERSSSRRESVERAQVIRAFYPGERDLGVMLTSRPAIAEDFVPQLQLGIFNGPGTTREVDAIKNIAARLTLPIPLGKEAPATIRVGGSYYYGGIPQKGSTVITWRDGERVAEANTESGGMAGFGNNRNVGVEAQIELDLLPIGTTSLRGEYLAGQRATAGSPGSPASVGIVRSSEGTDSIGMIAAVAPSPLAIRGQSGYYLQLVQHLGESVQLVAKYDAFDRNTDVEGAQVLAASEASSAVLALGVNYLWKNVRVMLSYEMPSFAAGESVAVDPATRLPIDALRDEDAKDNKTTLRLQYRF